MRRTWWLTPLCIYQNKLELLDPGLLHLVSNLLLLFLLHFPLKFLFPEQSELFPQTKLWWSNNVLCIILRYNENSFVWMIHYYQLLFCTLLVRHWIFLLDWFQSTRFLRSQLLLVIVIRVILIIEEVYIRSSILLVLLHHQQRGCCLLT